VQGKLLWCVEYQETLKHLDGLTKQNSEDKNICYVSEKYLINMSERIRKKLICIQVILSILTQMAKQVL
jgi:hypothetical protein